MTAPELALLIKKSGHEWLLGEGSNEKLEFYLDKLHEAYTAFQQKFTGDGIGFDDGVLDRAGTHELGAILQTLPWHSPDFIAAIWRIIQGDRIAVISMQYRSVDSFRLQLTIESEHQRIRREIISDRVEDAAFLRHVPIGRIDDKPFFAGYFPVRSSKQSPGCGA